MVLLLHSLRKPPNGTQTEHRTLPLLRQGQHCISGISGRSLYFICVITCNHTPGLCRIDHHPVEQAICETGNKDAKGGGHPAYDPDCSIIGGRPVLFSINPDCRFHAKHSFVETKDIYPTS